MCALVVMLVVLVVVLVSQELRADVDGCIT